MSKVKVIEGVLSTKHKSITNLSDALSEDSKCGCGIDCCEGVIRLEDKDTGIPHVVYVFGGELQVQTVADYEANGPGDQP